MKTILAVLCLMILSTGYAQTVVRCPQKDASLDTRWQWALRESKSQAHSGGYWIGYSFNRTAHENETVGTWYSDRVRRPTLAEVLSGTRIEPGYLHTDGPGRIVTKETAVLFRLAPGVANATGVQVSDLSLYVDLRNAPVFWLGLAPAEQSIVFLKSQYGHADPESRREVISAMGLHKKPELTSSFLQEIFLHEKNEETRGMAGYWLAAQNDPGALRFLKPLLEKENSEEVISQTLAGFEEIEGNSATKLLIDLSGEGHSIELRKQALILLAQQASKEAVDRLISVAYNDPDEEIEKQAVYALADMDQNDGILDLIKIAKTHHNPEIRKQAIYMLGDSGDPRARDALIQLVSK